MRGFWCRGLQVQRGLRSQVNDVAFQNGAHLHPPGFAAGQAAALGDGPEPQGAPVVHDEFQAAVGRGQVAIGVEQALAADVFLLGAADGVGVAVLIAMI